jgi:hypothetical protein
LDLDLTANQVEAIHILSKVEGTPLSRILSHALTDYMRGSIEVYILDHTNHKDISLCVKIYRIFGGDENYILKREIAA